MREGSSSASFEQDRARGPRYARDAGMAKGVCFAWFLEEGDGCDQGWRCRFKHLCGVQDCGEEHPRFLHGRERAGRDQGRVTWEREPSRSSRGRERRDDERGGRGKGDDRSERRDDERDERRGGERDERRGSERDERRVGERDD